MKRPRGASLFLLLPVSVASAQTMQPRLYEIGSPVLQEIWVDGTGGNDTNAGTSRDRALKTMSAALNRIPKGSPLTTGYRVQVMPGAYPGFYLGLVRGSFDKPVIIQAADGAGTASFARTLIDDCHYVYLIGLKFTVSGATSPYNVLHLVDADHILVRNCQILGQGDVAARTAPKEGLKANQSRHVYVENSEIAGAWENSIDFVAVQYGHLVGNRVHDCGSWVTYVKGGSGQLRIEANEFYNSPVGGFIAGQSTGLEWTVAPFVHYEAYNIKFINNVVRNVSGVGMAVGGGYNILLAHNTLYRVGSTTGPIRVVMGERTCDEYAALCEAARLMGAWGPGRIGQAEWIPAKNIFIYNNLVYNPPGWPTANRVFTIVGPVAPQLPDSNVANPIRVDENLVIRGNVVWHGSATTPLGIEAPDAGCQPANPTCNAAQLRAGNTINTLSPELGTDPATNLPVPVAGGNLTSMSLPAIPAFSGGDLPGPPLAPQGNLDNTVDRDWSGKARPAGGPPGAFLAPGDAPPPVTLKATPPNLVFRGVAGGPGPAQQDLVVESESALVDFTALAGGVAQVSPISSRTPSALKVWVDTAGRPAGVHAGEVILSSAGAVNSPLLVPVRLELTAPATLVSPTQISFSGTAGGPLPAAVSLSVSSSGVPLPFSASKDAAWLSLSAVSGTTPAKLLGQAWTAGLAAGSYGGTVTVLLPGGAPDRIQIPVTLTLSAPPPPPAGSKYYVSPGSLYFSVISGAPPPAVQSFRASSVPTGAPVAVSSSASWLSLRPLGTLTPAMVEARVNHGGLAPGNYAATATVRAPDGSGTPANVAVSLRVYARPSLIISPASLKFTGSGAVSPPSQRLVLGTSGVAVPFTAVAGAPWLVLPVRSGSANWTYLTVSVNTAGLAPGTYASSITISAPLASNSPKVIPVTLSVQ